MFADYVARILRRDWTFGLGPIKGKKYDQLSPDELAQSIVSTNASIKQLAEEIATLNGSNTPLTNYNFVEAQHSCPGVADLPPDFWRYDEMCAAGGSDNPLSHIKPDGKIKNGLAHKFRGVVLLEGDLVIRERLPNEPVGPAIPGAGGPAGPPGGNGGRIIYVNRAGDIIGECAVGIAVSNISARSGTTLGSGSCYIQKLTGAVVSTSTTDTVYNPHTYTITAGTYVVLGKVQKSNGSSVWVIIDVDGAFEPAYAVRNNASYSHTKSTTANITLDTPIHTKQSGDFTLATNEVTVTNQIMVHIDFSAYLSAIGGTTTGVVRLQDDGTDILGTERSYSVGPAGIFQVAISVDHCMSAANKKIRARITESGGAEDTYIYGAAGYGHARLDIRKVRNI